MKALTLTQPWASLVAVGAKHLETRSWKTDYRGPLAIHAAKNLEPVGGPAGLVQFYWQQPFHQVLKDAGYSAELDRELPRGSIVAVCNLGGCARTESFSTLTETYTPEARGREQVFGDYSPGRWAWILNAVSPIVPPVEIPKGAVRDYRGLWDVPAVLAEQLRAVAA